MKIILPLIIIFSSAWAVDYDPEFHNKHRYNKLQKMKGSHEKMQLSDPGTDQSSDTQLKPPSKEESKDLLKKE